MIREQVRVLPSDDLWFVLESVKARSAEFWLTIGELKARFKAMEDKLQAVHVQNAV